MDSCENDKDLIRSRFEHSFRRYDRLAMIQRRVSTELAKITADQAGSMPVRRILELGAGTGFLTSQLTEIWPDAEYFLNDISPECKKYLIRYNEGKNMEFLWGDAEKIEYPGNIDIIASAATMQWFDDIPAFLRKCAAASVRGGLIALSTFGPENFREIRGVTGIGLDYPTKDELNEMLVSAGYRVLRSKESTEILYFDIPLDVLHHIRMTGVNSLKRVRWTLGKVEEFSNAYKKLFTVAGGVVSLTYNPIILLAERT